MNQGRPHNNCGILQAYRGGEMSHDRRTIRNVDDEIYRIAPKTYQRGVVGRDARQEYGRDLREKRYLHDQMNRIPHMQGGGGAYQWINNTFAGVRDFLNKDSILSNVVGSAIKYGLPGILMGAKPKDALKYGAGIGLVSSLFGQPGAGPAAAGKGGRQTEGYATTEDQQAALRAEMEKAGVEKLGTAGSFDPHAAAGAPSSSVYTEEQVEDFRETDAGKSVLSAMNEEEIDERGFVDALMAGDLKQAFLPDSRAFADKNDYIRQYGPLLGLGIGGLYLSGAFDPQQPTPLPDAFGGQTWQGLQRANPNAYRSAPTFVPRGNAHGGPIQSFPRRNGMIRGPGTETSDDIPAMLSDGEFVMTAEAVRGAGNGNREQGMRRMYDVMHHLERTA